MSESLSLLLLLLFSGSNALNGLLLFFYNFDLSFYINFFFPKK